MKKKLTLMGYIVIGPKIFSHTDKSITLNQDQIKMLDKMHRHMIAMSDEIFIIDKDEYISNSTKREIKFAESLSKPIAYYSEEIQKIDKNKFIDTGSNSQISNSIEAKLDTIIDLLNESISRIQ